ncbi:competence protein CoiA family protein [Chitinophaga sp. CC14]|uniref:competence protein CoiA n=1 Tax=Chitinophaga sp. CC14 TaxID=3029199 RepID=UPI003B7F6787
MRFALIDNLRVEAEPGLKGICPGCMQPVIAKCGAQRIHHWAHSRSIACDKWWEAETEWHRAWKNNFPLGWQEVFLPDAQTGQKHIADVQTEHGLVIEFQHSHLNPQERIARETFYKNMVWVVDGTRLKYDYRRFVKGHDYFQYTEQKGIFHVKSPEDCFPQAWLNSQVPVIFDFKGQEPLEDLLGLREPLYCLFPASIGKSAVVAKISRKAFIKHTTNGEWPVRVSNLMSNLINALQASQRQEELLRLALQHQDLEMKRFGMRPGYGKSRPF